MGRCESSDLTTTLELSTEQINHVPGNTTACGDYSKSSNHLGQYIPNITSIDQKSSDICVESWQFTQPISEKAVVQESSQPQPTQIQTQLATAPSQKSGSNKIERYFSTEFIYKVPQRAKSQGRSLIHPSKNKLSPNSDGNISEDEILKEITEMKQEYINDCQHEIVAQYSTSSLEIVDRQKEIEEPIYISSTTQESPLQRHDKNLNVFRESSNKFIGQQKLIDFPIQDQIPISDQKQAQPSQKTKMKRKLPQKRGRKPGSKSQKAVRAPPSKKIKPSILENFNFRVKNI